MNIYKETKMVASKYVLAVLWVLLLSANFGELDKYSLLIYAIEAMRLYLILLI